MKRNILIISLLVSLCVGSIGADTIGILGRIYPSGYSLTGSYGKVEAEVGLSELLSGNLIISADYNLIDGGIAENLSWNGALGPGIDISSSGVTISIIAPVELVYNIEPILNGMDVYMQAKPMIPLNPTPSFDFEIGLGLRFAY